VSGYVNRTIDGRAGGVHQHIAESALGRPLPHGVEVHHVDGDPSNNAPSNLVICQDRSYHRLLHRRARALRELGDANGTLRTKSIVVSEPAWYRLRSMAIAESTTVGRVIERLLQNG
jgi:hypothetical protein